MVRNISKSGDLRRARWVSSINGDSSQLGRLQAHLQIFYSSSERDPYQAMLDKQDDDYFQKDNPAKAVIDLICALAPSQILEIGCSHGGAYRALRTRAFRGEYVGCDVSQSVIERDRTRHPETTWTTSSAYQLPFRDDSFDACFSIYVLEHL